MARKIFWTLLLPALAGACWYLFVPSGGGGDREREVVRKGTVERGDLRLTVSATGEVKPLRVVELKSKAIGQVVRFSKRVGDRVSNGERIAALDRATEERNLRKAKADRDTAQARLTIEFGDGVFDEAAGTVTWTLPAATSTAASERAASRATSTATAVSTSPIR
jgi:multidrug efflux pump subunit AcrA (membrane-fusion protein)